MAEQKITPFLMFFGQAEEAMNYYCSVFERSEIVSMQKYGPNQPGAEGTVIHAVFSLHGQTFMCIDARREEHAFTLTPAISFWVTCETEAEVDRAFAMLSDGGAVLMPLGEYPFSRKYAWVQDKFGVSWQVSLG